MQLINAAHLSRLGPPALAFALVLIGLLVMPVPTHAARQPEAMASAGWQGRAIQNPRPRLRVVDVQWPKGWSAGPVGFRSGYTRPGGSRASPRSATTTREARLSTGSGRRPLRPAHACRNPVVPVQARPPDQRPCQPFDAGGADGTERPQAAPHQAPRAQHRHHPTAGHDGGRARAATGHRAGPGAGPGTGRRQFRQDRPRAAAARVGPRARHHHRAARARAAASDKGPGAAGTAHGDPATGARAAAVLARAVVRDRADARTGAPPSPARAEAGSRSARLRSGRVEWP